MSTNRKGYDHEWCKKNRDKKRAIQRRYLEKLKKNPEKLAAAKLRMRQYHKDHYVVIRISQWAIHFHCCVKCGKTDSRHKGKGLCARCWSKKHNPGYRKRQHEWYLKKRKV